jgi:hypothetical protein
LVPKALLSTDVPRLGYLEGASIASQLDDSLELTKFYPAILVSYQSNRLHLFALDEPRMINGNLNLDIGPFFPVFANHRYPVVSIRLFLKKQLTELVALRLISDIELLFFFELLSLRHGSIIDLSLN